jgi:hypothetical protein
MSAFSAAGDFVPRLPAHPLRADATADPSFGRLVATRRHSDVALTAWILSSLVVTLRSQGERLWNEDWLLF